jgi:hypothetical protein
LSFDRRPALSRRAAAPVSELVRQVVVALLREQLNGNGTASLGSWAEPAVSNPENAQQLRRRPGPIPKPAPAERRCNRCGETKPAGEYARGRGTCHSCRRAQWLEHDRRAALAEADEPHPAPSPQEGRKSRRRLDSDRYWNERRRALIEEARVTTEERDGRGYVVRHLAPQFGPASEFPRASGVSNAPRG